MKPSPFLNPRSTPTVLILAGALLSTSVHAQDPVLSPAVQLEKAIFEEETTGNLDKALAQFAKLANDSTIPPAIRETALFRLGRGLETTGRTDDAHKTYQDCLTQFPNGAHATQVRDRLRQPGGDADIAASVNMLGLWESGAGYLELLPKNRFQRFVGPLDSSEFSAPAKPLAQGSYELTESTLELQPAQGDAESFAWAPTEAGVQLKKKGEAKPMFYRRARRPFRIPKSLDSLAEVAALMSLKAAEAKPVSKFLAEGGNPQAALDMITLSAPINAELRRLTRGTTAELIAQTGLAVLDLTAQLLEKNDGDGVQSALTTFSSLGWGPGPVKHLGPYLPDPSSVIGGWSGTLRSIPTTVHFDSKQFRMHPANSFEIKDAYTLTNNQIMLGSGESLLFLVDRDRLSLYDLTDGELQGSFQRDASDMTQGLEALFHDHALVLESALKLSQHARFRLLLIDYLYRLSTYTEGTTAGLLTRTAVRQIMQVEAAYLAGAQPKARALAEALGGTLALLMRRSLPHQLPDLEILFSDQNEPKIPFSCIYDGGLTLRPAEKGQEGEGIFGVQAQALREQILKHRLLNQVLDEADPNLSAAFLKEFAGFTPAEITDLLELHLTVEVVNPPLALRVTAFSHPTSAVAQGLSQALGKAIEELPPHSRKLALAEDDSEERATRADLRRQGTVFSRSQARRRAW